MKYENRPAEPSAARTLFERLKDLQGISDGLSRLPSSKLRERLKEMVTQELEGTSTNSDLQSEVDKLQLTIQERDNSIRELQDDIKELTSRDHRDFESVQSSSRDWFGYALGFLGGVIVFWIISRMI